MPAEKSPAFQFYIRDWRSSRKVQAMSFGERGMYLEMLIEQWDKGAAPSSAAACALALGGAESAWVRAWTALSPCFISRKRDGLLVNAKLEAIRRMRKKYLKSQQQSGLDGATERWRAHRLAIGSPKKEIAKNSSASATATATANKEEPPNPLSAKGGRRPYTRADLADAKRVRKLNFGQCGHEPTCAGGVECEVKTAVGFAERRKVAAL